MSYYFLVVYFNCFQLLSIAFEIVSNIIIDNVQKYLNVLWYKQGGPPTEGFFQNLI